MKVINIIGNIASGKSSAMWWHWLYNLGKGYQYLREPVKDNPFLDFFYREPGRIGYPMQFFMSTYYFTQIWEHYRAGSSIVVTDCGCPCIFHEALYNNYDYCSAEKKQTLDSFMRHLAEEMPPHRVFYIFIDIDPYECLKRINKRGRKCEEKIDIKYLEALSRQYRKFAYENNAYVVSSGKSARKTYKKINDIITRQIL